MTILLSKIEFIIYHKEKGRLNISETFVLKQVLATNQFQTLTRGHRTGIAVPTADLININIETVGNGVQSITFTYSVGNVFESGCCGLLPEQL